jgi:ribosomal protein L35
MPKIFTFSAAARRFRARPVATLLDRHQGTDIRSRSASVNSASRKRHAILGRADDLDQLVLGDRIAGLAAQDVVEARLGTAFVAQSQEILQWIGNPPAGEEIDRDVELVLGRHVRGTAVPLEHPFVDRIDLLDKGHLDLQTGGGHGFTDRLAELGDDHLLDFADRIDRTHREVGTDRDNAKRLSICSWPPPVLGIQIQQRQDAAVCSSIMIFERMPGMTSCRVSM